jgi:hypothetical protein
MPIISAKRVGYGIVADIDALAEQRGLRRHRGAALARRRRIISCGSPLIFAIMTVPNMTHLPAVILRSVAPRTGMPRFGGGGEP